MLHDAPSFKKDMRGQQMQKLELSLLYGNGHAKGGSPNPGRNDNMRAPYNETEALVSRISENNNTDDTWLLSNSLWPEIKKSSSY